MRIDIMKLRYLINFQGYEDWVEGEYALSLAQGEVITRDGEIIGTWRVVDYHPDAADDPSLDQGGRYEFIAKDHTTPMFAESFALLDIGLSRGMALSNISRTIADWHLGPLTEEADHAVRSR
jgi:hypothetical protein